MVDHDLCVHELCEGEWQLFLHHMACKLVLIGQLLLVLLYHQVVHGKLYRLPQLFRMDHYKGFVGYAMSIMSNTSNGCRYIARRGFMGRC